MKKLKSILLCFIALIFSLLPFVSACSSKENDEDNLFTGPLISGKYFFETYSELCDFYEIFKIKNPERFLLPDFDGVFEEVTYGFDAGLIRADIIADKIYDYDFNQPIFEILLNDIQIYIGDLNEVDITEKHDIAVMKDPYPYPRHKIQINGATLISIRNYKAENLPYVEESDIEIIFKKFEEELNKCL